MGSMGSFTWEAIEWLLPLTRLPVLLKGIMNPDDADQAVRTGAAGIIVSNHGGRCLDTLPASIGALAPVVEKVAGRVPVLVDGGIRRGTDMIKAIALGAKACMIGRPFLYGLGAGGQAGCEQAIRILLTELDRNLALLGCPRVEDLNRSFLRHTGYARDGV